MKGTLLLALLVIGELGFQTTEACYPFIDGYIRTLLGKRTLMHLFLSRFDATVEERVAFEKLQDCYNEEGLKAKFLDPKIMVSLIFSRECRTYYPIDSLKKIEGLLELYKSSRGEWIFGQPIFASCLI